MSMPTFSKDAPTREEAISQILSSIAMEELGLSHILNAEGEKLQYVLGTLEGITGPDASIDEVLHTNKSVQDLLKTMSMNQMLLGNKMSDALSASTMQGPPGPIGPTGATGAGPLEPGAALFSVEGPDNQAIPLNYGDSLVFTTGTPELLDISVTEGSAVVALNVVDGIGATGATGNTGADGIQGATGPAPIITFGEPGNIIIDGVTGPNLMGPTGNTGSEPVVTVDVMGDIIINGVTGPNLMGPMGRTGNTGLDGIDGAQGPTGATPIIAFDESGDIIIDGITGPNLMGPTGNTGSEPIVTVDVAGDIIINGVTGPNLMGPMGRTGNTGLDGIDGAQGPTGPTPIITFDESGDIIVDGVTGPNLMGPTGQPGGVGTILGNFDTLADLETAVPTGAAGDLYYVSPDLYAWNEMTNDWLNVGPIQGPTGSTGLMGSQGIQGDTGPMGATGDTGIQGIQGDTGPQGVQGEQGIQGQTGIQGPQGVAGTVGTILGSFDTLADLEAAVPTGSAGEFYYVNPNLYIWDDLSQSWEDIGPIAGPQGITGSQGIDGIQGPAGTTGADGSIGPMGPLGPTGVTGNTGAPIYRQQL